MCRSPRFSAEEARKETERKEYIEHYKHNLVKSLARGFAAGNHRSAADYIAKISLHTADLIMKELFEEDKDGNIT